MEAPIIFSFNENPIGVVRLIGQIEENFKSNLKTYIKLKKVKQIDYGAVLALLAIMFQFKEKELAFDGDIPADRVASRILVASGFFRYLSKKIIGSDRYELVNGGKNEIIAWKKVDSELGDRVIASASQTVWSSKRRCQGVQRTLVELMHNTNNHASINRIGEKQWWLFVHHDDKLKIVSFAFVDFGVGVFSSLEHKPKEDKFYNWIDKMKSFFSWNSRADLLKLILEGKLHQTVTGKQYRGKGLPGIAEAEQRNKISSLKVITNDVFASPSTNQFKMLPSSLSGTYIYWELGENNESFPDEEAV